MTRLAVGVALVSAALVAAVGFARGTWAVGGSDSSCYGLMARAYAEGGSQPHSALPETAPWPAASLTAAPAGFIPSPVTRGAASPVCAPGFSLLAAVLMVLAGPPGFFWVSPLCGAVMVWCASLTATRLGGPLAGGLAAMLTATTPIVLYQVVQPMNDVATGALWMAAIAALVVPRRPLFVIAGLCAGTALLVRPNLLPVGLLFGIGVLASHGLAAALRFGAAVLPGGIAVLVLNTVLYGTPLGSGYGAASGLFATGNIALNLVAHGRALFETQGGWPLLGLLAPLMLPAAARRAAWLVVAVAVALVMSYLPYRPYPEWWYLRFLLPAIVLLIVLASSMLGHLASLARAPRPVSSALVVIASLVAVLQWRSADRHQVFALQEFEQHFRLAAETVRDRLPPRAVAITVWESGSIRFHADREAVLWDSLDPAWLDRAIAWLTEQGYTPVVVVERWEEPLFRDRFASQVYGGLDWPPRFDVDSRVRVLVPADRARYLAGDPVVTEAVWPAR
jgi:hypothetical protein